MKRLVLAVAFFLSLFSFSVSAAQFSVPSENFPEGWKEVQTGTCTPKTGVVLENKVYAITAHNNTVMLVMQLTKNGVLTIQTQIMLVGDTPIGLYSEILDGDNLHTFDSNTDGDLQRIKEVTYKALDLTEAEFASCKK